MSRRILLGLLAASAMASSAMADPMPRRVRGTIVSVSDDKLVVHPASGADIPVALTGTTRFSTLGAATLANVEPGSYIGAAAKPDGDHLVAVEVLIFPPALKGAGEGHYGWDPLPDAAATTMTNGTVATSMTNGTVGSAAEASGARKLTVAYKDGEQVIMVPPGVPIVLLQPADRSVAKPGEAVFVSGVEDGGTITARSVTAGANGVKPPM